MGNAVEFKTQFSMAASESATNSNAPFVTINPAPFIKSLIGKTVEVVLKWNMSYVGTLCSTDSYMNIYLNGTEEFQQGTKTGYVGECLIRCNNIFKIREFVLEELPA